jgi:hypothetical protein
MFYVADAVTLSNASGFKMCVYNGTLGYFLAVTPKACAKSWRVSALMFSWLFSYLLSVLCSTKISEASCCCDNPFCSLSRVSLLLGMGCVVFVANQNYGFVQKRQIGIIMT